MLFDNSFTLLAANDRLLDPKFVESLKLFGVSPLAYVPLVLIALSVAAGYLLAQWLRQKDYGWKYGLILAAWTASLSVILLGQFKLGVDLRGGVNLVYEVDEEKTALLNPKGDYDLDGVVDVLRRRLNPAGIMELVIRKSGPQQIEIVVPEVDKGQIDEIKRRVVTGGALRFLIVANNQSKDGHIIDAAKAQAENEQRKMDLEVKDEEGNTIGLWMEVAREDVKGRTTVESPFRHTPVYRDVIRDSRTGDLITLTPSEQSELAVDETRLSKLLAERGIREIDVLLRAPDSPDIDVRGEDLAYASPSLEMGGWQINFTMKGEGIGKMSALTGQNLPQPERNLAIVFDNELVSAPVIQGHISDQGQITGRFTEDEVRFMAELLKSGSMPVVLHETPIAENLIGSILGQDTIVKGSWSIAISLAVVLVVVALYYRFAGIVASLAVILNMLLTLSIMMVIQAPLTLPGLAGLVLALGMSVDANVLIFERIREELSRGAALRMAIRNGFDRAFITIVDSNLTTLLTAVVLYVIGTDQLKGFGVTVSLGILTNMFTAIFCARVIFDSGERTRLLKTLSMTHFLTKPSFNWLRLFAPGAMVSAVVIVVGLAATVARGTGIFDIDLKGGTTVTAMLRKPASDAQVREALNKEFQGVAVSESGGRVDFQVYEISLQGEAPGTVYKIDSSFEKAADLENHVQHALKDPETGEDLVRTYRMEYKLVSSTSAENEAAAGASQPESPAGKQGTTPAPATAPSGEGSDEDEADSSPPARAPDCGQADEEAAAGQEQNEGKVPADPKVEPAADAGKAESAEAAAKDELAPAESTTKEPAPAASSSPAAPAREATPAAETPAIDADVETTFEVRFPQNRISAYALEEHIREAAEKAINQNPFVKVANTEWDGRDNSAFESWTVTLKLSEESAEKVLAELKKTMEVSPVWQNSSSVSGQVTFDTQLRALNAILVSMLGIAAYIWFRFQKLSWGIAAVVSLLHNTLVMLTAIAVSYWLAPVLGILLVEEFKISLIVVAAFLTVIGYSINDTIVIFDRIREMRGKSTELTSKMVNDAINQTLSRTILTGGLVIVVLIILYIWGGEGIHTFAYCMLVGVIAGTYSTIFVATPLLLWLLGSKPAVAPATKPAAVKQPVTTGGRT